MLKKITKFAIVNCMIHPKTGVVYTYDRGINVFITHKQETNQRKCQKNCRNLFYILNK